MAGECQACADVALTRELPATGEGSNAAASGVLDLSCGTPDAAEVRFAFEAPRAGPYVFDTSGSTIDTVMAIFEGSCELGQELICNDDAPFALTSRATVALSKGQVVTVAVEGYDGEQGTIQLTVSEPDDEATAVGGQCEPQSMLASSHDSLSVSTADQLDTYTASCAVSGVGDVAVEFVAPTSGNYRFDTVGSSFDTILAVLDNDCLGLELGCNDDTYGLQSEVTVNLEAGQTVVVIVDGYEETGDAMLNVTTDSAGSLPACCTAEAGAGCGDTDIEACVCSADDFCCTEQWDDLCAAAVTDLGCGVCAPSASDTSSSCASPEVLEGELPLLLSGTTVGGSSATGASCGGEAGPETVYTFTAPATGDYVVDTNGSVMDTLLYVLQGDCEGEELACNDDQDDSLQSRVELSLTQGQQVRIVPCEVRVIARPSNGGR